MVTAIGAERVVVVAPNSPLRPALLYGTGLADVIGIPDDEWGETVAAAVVLAPGGEVGIAELPDWVRARLRSSPIPTVIEFRAALPYNETGKLLRRVLRTQLVSSGAVGRG